MGQKRRRDGDGDDDRTTRVKRPHQIQDDEDEGESRSAAISAKKARIAATRRSGHGKPEKTVDTADKEGGEDTEESQTLTLFSIPTDILTGAPLPTPKHAPPTPSSIVNGNVPVASRPSPSRHPPPSPILSQPTPLLNLHGPPVGKHEEETITHSQGESGAPKKKKRRRRGKRRKNHGGEDAV